MLRETIDSIQKTLEAGFENPNIVYGLAAVLIFYTTFFYNNTPKIVADTIHNEIGRLVFLALIALVTYYSPLIGILLAIVYITSAHGKEGFDNKAPVKCGDLAAVVKTSVKKLNVDLPSKYTSVDDVKQGLTTNNQTVFKQTVADLKESCAATGYANEMKSEISNPWPTSNGASADMVTQNRAVNTGGAVSDGPLGTTSLPLAQTTIDSTLASGGSRDLQAVAGSTSGATEENTAVSDMAAPSYSEEPFAVNMGGVLAIDGNEGISGFSSFMGGGFGSSGFASL
ncbi:MAG: hypothetical protein F2563_04160 [Actinobacteria bacterium]|uniref:Unannotated protein n=1 Tax=freshwater metagenome TaxID=449393 RepID=A0A6J6EVS8_9ZZZZ|nr:hypothetical protein [Actinomycetota bacterium]